MNFKNFGYGILCVVTLLLVLLFIWLKPNPWLFSVELRDFDPSKAIICENLRQKMVAPQKEKIRFFVSSSPALNMASVIRNGGERVVYFSYDFIENGNIFEEVAAHELGHIEYNTLNQVLADLFAMKIFGKERMLELRSNLSEQYRAAMIRCYDSNGSDCPDVSH